MTKLENVNILLSGKIYDKVGYIFKSDLKKDISGIDIKVPLEEIVLDSYNLLVADMKDMDVYEVNTVAQYLRLCNRPVVLVLDSSDNNMNVIRRFEYSYHLDAEKMYAYFNLHLPTCKGCMEVLYNPKEEAGNSIVEIV
jgi:mRNA degradation ribonuclease J1/J2